MNDSLELYGDAVKAWQHEKARAEAAEARCAELERTIEFRDRHRRTSDKLWRRAAEEALSGNPTALKNRIAMMDEPPVGATLSDTAPIEREGK